MPYGYEVANSKLPQAADPIGSLMQGGVQGLTLGLGLQKARQEANLNQLQQQAAMQEMERKKFEDFKNAIELTQTPSFRSLAKKDQATIGNHLGKKISDYLGQPIEIPEWNDEYNIFTKRITDILSDDNVPEQKKRPFIANVLGEASEKLSKDKFSNIQDIAEFGLKQPSSAGSLIYLGQQDGSATLMNNKTGEMRSAGLPGNGPLMPKNVTNEMSNSSLFSTRANDANQQLNGLIQKGFDPTSLSAGAQKLLPNYFQGENAQALEQIGRNFGAAVLRKESGAAITTDEWKQVKLQYIPQPGDKAETLKQKEINRARAIQGLGYMGGQLPELKNNTGLIKFEGDEEKQYQEWKKSQLMGK